MDAQLVIGGSGVFTVAVDGKVVARRNFTGFPTEEEIVDAVAKALGR